MRHEGYILKNQEIEKEKSYVRDRNQSTGFYIM